MDISRPVCSAEIKHQTGGLVVRWVTTSESPLLYVLIYILLFSQQTLDYFVIDIRFYRITSDVSFAKSFHYIKIRMGNFSPTFLAIPSVLILISFLSYSSQILFVYIDPYPLTRKEYFVFNVLILCLLTSYIRACVTSPGRIPEDWEQIISKSQELGNHNKIQSQKERWCRKCNATKPPRTHHCKTCGR